MLHIAALCVQPCNRATHTHLTLPHSLHAISFGTHLYVAWKII